MRLLLVFLILLSMATHARCAKVQQPAPEPVYAVWNADTGNLLISNRADEVRPIASITKLMVVFVVLNSDLNLEELLLVTGPESSRHIKRGMLVSRGKLVELALVSSDNLAARTLAETYPGGYHAFIDLMNGTAKELRMETTTYTDATGLLSSNRSTAADIAKLVLATQKFPIFQASANTRNFVVEAIGKIKNKVQTLLIKGKTTNGDFVGKLDLVAAKTGYTSAAGRCLAMMFVKNGQRYILFVAGLQTPTERKNIVESLINKVT